jgi:hypothetical protein
MHHVLIYTNEADWLAARIPGAKYGTIEVRPVLELTSEHRSAHHAALSRCLDVRGILALAARRARRRADGVGAAGRARGGSVATARVAGEGAAAGLGQQHVVGGDHDQLAAGQ